jgi:GT2 family glycosyltransferase
MDSKIEFDVCILIVLYNCAAENSATILSLKENISELDGIKLRIVIWNNGPSELSDEDIRINLSDDSGVNIEFQYIQDVSNAPLAYLYNKVISGTRAKNYCILDHDTKLTSEYIGVVRSCFHYDLVLPIVIARGQIHGPIYNSEIITNFGPRRVGRRGRILAIGSGLIISRNLIDIMIFNYKSVFDERYALYGVDTTFCLRVTGIPNADKLNVWVLGIIYHSLSRLEKENDSIRDFRAKERGLDLGITLRHYFSLYWLYRSIVKIIKSMAMNEPFSKRFFFEGLFRGEHPRAFKRT